MRWYQGYCSAVNTKLDIDLFLKWYDNKRIK